MNAPLNSAPTLEPRSAPTASRRWPRVAAAVAAAAGILAMMRLLPLGHWLLGVVSWAVAAGPAGAALYGLAYVAATVLLIPGSLLTLGAGFVYGPVLGTLIVSPASVLGATLAFTFGRTFARRWIRQRIEGNARFAAVDRAIGASGFKIVFLLRLSPIFPFTLLNYALGLTEVPVSRYVLASFLGMLPGTILYVYLGSLVTSATELASGVSAGAAHAAAGRWLYWGGLAATVAVTVIITRIARKALQSALDQPAPGPGSELAHE